ncbi:hypothetical protein ACUOA8_53265, partial [Escherichia sp. SS-MK2]
QRLVRRPTVARLEITETNGDRINEKTIGASQNRKRDRRLVLLSDPVTMARLHFRVWNSPERYSSWVSYYEGIKLNPLDTEEGRAAADEWDER